MLHPPGSALRLAALPRLFHSSPSFPDSRSHMSDTEASTPTVRQPRAQPESFRGRSLAASLSVSDLRASVAWYRDVLGFTVDREMVRDGRLAAVAVKAGDVALMLNQDDGAKGAGRVKGQGLSFMITTSQDIDGIAARVRENGGMLDTEPADMPWGARVFRLRDPDGFSYAISSERRA